MVDKGAPEWVTKLLPGKRIVSCQVDSEGTEAVVEYNDELVGPNRTQRVVLKQPQIPDEVAEENKGQSKVVADSTKQVDSKEPAEKPDVKAQANKEDKPADKKKEEKPQVPDDKKADHPDKKAKDAKFDDGKKK